MKFIQSATLMGGVMALNAIAGTLEIVGDGQTRAGAEFLKLTINLQGECFGTSVEARQSVAALSDQVKNTLSSELSPGVEGQLQIFPGANSQAEKVKYVNGVPVLVCDLQHGWRSNANVVFKLTNLNHLAEVQDALLGLNPTNSQNGLNALTLIMGAPQPGVFEVTYNELVDKALEKAFANAQRQVDILLRKMPGQMASLQRVTPTLESSGQVSYDRTQMASDPDGLSLGSVTVSISRKFVFKTEAQK